MAWPRLMRVNLWHGDFMRQMFYSKFSVSHLHIHNYCAWLCLYIRVVSIFWVDWQKCVLSYFNFNFFFFRLIFHYSTYTVVLICWPFYYPLSITYRFVCIVGTAHWPVRAPNQVCHYKTEAEDRRCVFSFFFNFYENFPTEKKCRWIIKYGYTYEYVVLLSCCLHESCCYCVYACENNMNL